MSSNDDNRKKGYSISGTVIGIIVLAIMLWTGLGDPGTDDTDNTSSAAVTTVTIAADAVTDADATENTENQAAETESADTKANANAKSYTFRNSTKLEDHYKKHGIEMGFDSADDYQAAANDVINDPTALHKTEKEDGDDVYFIESTNEFVIVSTDGYIRTYYICSGKAYFDRQ